MKKTLRTTRERRNERDLRVEFNWLLSHRTSHKEEKKSNLNVILHYAERVV